YLEERSFKVGIYHAHLPLDKRLENISNYRKGNINILVSCRALDEGFDVPESNTGIIVAGTSSVRQWIQRMGRILRRMPGKEFSRIYVVFVDIVEKDVFKETELREFEKEALSVESINLTFK
ncbi:MAG: helicase-related protein, partial [Acidobacteriota bacterium]|nr:helicase-related protein [Acidobacteriota bacterium]